MQIAVESVSLGHPVIAGVGLGWPVIAPKFWYGKAAAYAQMTGQGLIRGILW
jgi:hypothetical protein